MDTAAVRTDWVGRLIGGRFTLLQWLGGSSESAVFATSLPDEPEQRAAIKLFPADDSAENRLAAWAAASNLSHPHLVRIFEFGQCEVDGASLLYVVTEYADEVLGEILTERALTPDEVKQMLGPILDALDYLHAHHFAHACVKPSNLLDVGDVLKLSADSIQRLGSIDRDRSGLNVYDAPEYAAGVLTPACDAWSFGVTLVEALTQRPPNWERTSKINPAVPDSIPEPLARIVRRCLQIDPAQRFTVRDIRRSLDPSVASLQERGKEEPVERIDTPVAERMMERPRAKKQLRLQLIIAAVVVLIAVVAFVLPRSQKPQPSTQPESQQQTAPAATSPAPQQEPPVGRAGIGGQAANGPVTKGSIAQRANPEVSPAASDTIRGTVNVRVRLQVDASGNVSNATFDSAGPSKYFARVAMQAAQQWKFTPATANGQPAASVWILQFQFTRDGVDVIPTEETP